MNDGSKTKRLFYMTEGVRKKQLAEAKKTGRLYK